MDGRTGPQQIDSLGERLRRAEVDLEQALRLFRDLRRTALAGDYDYDSEAFDRAILACRAAAAVFAHAAGAARRRPPPGSEGPPARTPDQLARLRFARWLVETGRLTDQGAA
jgi:hypothetical protein